MRVFLVGATGVYGRALIPRLVARGDSVLGIARSVAQAESLQGASVEVIEADLLHTPQQRLAEMMRGCDAAAHLATALRPGATGPDGANSTTALRIEGTRNLLDALRLAGVRRYVQQSIVMAYPDGADGWLDESTPFDRAEERASMVKPVTAMEDMVRGLDSTAIAWSILRGGSFVGPGTAQDGVIDRLRNGMQRVPGDGHNWVSFIHVEDIADATVAAFDRAPAGSTFNITDEPIRNGDYLDRLAALVGATAPPRDAAAALPRSFRCTNAAAKQALGWAPRHGIWPDLGR